MARACPLSGGPTVASLGIGRGYDRQVEHWEAYALGAIGISLVVGSLTGQIAAVMEGDVSRALALAFGLVGGVAVYRCGYRQLSR